MFVVLELLITYDNFDWLIPEMGVINVAHCFDQKKLSETTESVRSVQVHQRDRILSFKYGHMSYLKRRMPEIYSLIPQICREKKISHKHFRISPS